RVAAGRPVGADVKLQPADELRSAPRCVRRAHAIETALKDQLCASADRVIAAALLTHVADPLTHLVRQLEQVAPGHCRLAATWRQQGRQHPQRGCLAGAVGAEEAEDGGCLDTEIDSGHGFDGALASSERPAQAAGLDHATGCHGGTPCWCVVGPRNARWYA